MRVIFWRSEYSFRQIQNEKSGKVLKLSFEIKSKNEKIEVKMKGVGDLFVEDNQPYESKSEWLETDLDITTYFLVDHQDTLDIIEIMCE